jgi:ribose transport system permease protein
MMMVNFFVGRFLLVPATVWVLLLVAGATVFVLTFTTIGRRFIAVSVNPRAAHAVGVPLKAYSILTYTTAGLMYAIAAVMLWVIWYRRPYCAGCLIFSAPSPRSWSAAIRSVA